MLPGQMLPWQLESVLYVPRNLSLKFHQKQVLRYSWYGQMSQGQMLPGQMSPWQLESVLYVPRNLSSKFHLSNSWDILDIEFVWVGWGVQSHFIVKPNLVLRLGRGFDKIFCSKKFLVQNFFAYLYSNILAYRYINILAYLQICKFVNLHANRVMTHLYLNFCLA